MLTPNAVKALGLAERVGAAHGVHGAEGVIDATEMYHGPHVGRLAPFVRAQLDRERVAAVLKDGPEAIDADVAGDEAHVDVAGGSVVL